MKFLNKPVNFALVILGLSAVAIIAGNVFAAPATHCCCRCIACVCPWCRC